MPRSMLTHIDASGAARMVDVGHKPVTVRQAVAEGFVTLQPATLRAISRAKVPKGEVLNTARIAGIQAAKGCGSLIPLCHPLCVESVSIDFEPQEKRGRSRLRILATARVTGKTGVEIEALTAVSIAALTVYDMCKAIDKTMSIEGIRLLAKTK